MKVMDLAGRAIRVDDLVGRQTFIETNIMKT
ncbi:hypothetical protein QFZ20_000733 [Flavobacterium sp. W4I14]|nr:hypothetical protein [Flavobacterium sp. W4I14]